MQYLCLYVLFLSYLAVSCDGFYWTHIAPNSTIKPPARAYAGLAWTATELYLYGGKADTGALSDTWYFSFFTQRWSALTSPLAKPSARYGFVSGQMGNYWYITHGCSETDGVFSDTWAFSFLSKSWSRVNTSGEDGDETPVGRYSAAGGADTGGVGVGSTDSLNQLWMSMGINKAGRKLSDMWILTINTSTPLQGVWKRVSIGVGINQYNPALPHARGLASGLPLGRDKFILSGGCANGGQVGGPCPLDDSWIYSDNKWSPLQSCNIPSHSSSFVPLNSHSHDIGILYGGSQTGPGPVSQVITSSKTDPAALSVFNVSSVQWIRVQVEAGYRIPSLRSATQMTSAAVGVYMFGGKDENGVFLDDLWLLQRGSVNVTTVPCPRAWFTFLHLHGIFMYIAWGLVLPFGALLGRYYQWSCIRWYIPHIILQVTGSLFTFIGFLLVFLVSTEPSFSHGVIGIILMFSITQQFMTGLIRPWHCKKSKGRFENTESFKYKWKQCWKIYHQASGLISIALGFVQITLGVLLINGPSAVWITWSILLTIWLLVFLGHEITHFCYSKLHCDTKTEA